MTEMQKAGPHHETGPHENTCNPEDTPTEAALFAATRGYCVLVSTTEGKYRRRLFLSLHAAEKAKKRAQARGCYAALVLAVIVPTGVAE